MPTSTGPISRTISERTTAAPVNKVYTRTIDGVSAPLTVPEPPVTTVTTSSSTRNHTDN